MMARKPANMLKEEEITARAELNGVTKGACATEYLALHCSKNSLTLAIGLFLRREWKVPPGRSPAVVPIALVDDDEQACSVIEAVLRPHGWTTERADAEITRRILAAGFPAICLLVTCTIELLDDLKSDFPVILTLEEGVPGSITGQLLRMQRVVIVRKPIGKHLAWTPDARGTRLAMRRRSNNLDNFSTSVPAAACGRARVSRPPRGKLPENP